MSKDKYDDGALAHLEPRESAVRMLDSHDSGHADVTFPSDEDARRAVSH